MERLLDKSTKIIKIFLLVFATLVFIFSLLSGAETQSGGIKRIILNSPNSLPWLFLLIIVYFLWKKELIGGLLLSSMGIFTIIFFRFYRTLIGLFVISIPFIIFGALFIINAHLKNKE